MESQDNLKRVRFLEGDRLLLTPLSMADIDDHYRWENDRELQYLDLMPRKPKSIEQLRADFDYAFKSKDSVWFSIIDSKFGRLMGAIMLLKLDMTERKAFWGIKMDKAYWRQGFGSEAARLLLRYAFTDLSLRRLRSATHSSNVASQRFQEKLGFVHEGTMRNEYMLWGAYVDELMYGMLKEDYDAIHGSR
jgi:RimJ/RimL family protein N-acetyltransferase